MIDFLGISLLVTLAALLGMLANKLKQPPLLGYILAGVIIGTLGIFKDNESSSLELFSKIGVTFLLFILGIELNIKDLKKLGKVVVITGIGQIVFTTIFGYGLSLIQGFSSTSSLYLAIALTFSSTIVIVKLLGSKKELNSLHGKIAVGFLLVQDFAAMLILMALVAFGSAGNNSNLALELGLVVFKGFILFIFLWIVNKYLIGWIIKQTNHDREVLFMVIIAWALFLSALVAAPPLFNFSIEIGALLAGITLSSRKEALEIESWTRPLRDFFLTIFFVMLGLSININEISGVILPSLLFSVFVLIGNPIIVMVIMGVLGYNKRTSFFTSLTVAQISEFSILVVAMGKNIGHLGQNEITTITLVGGITMALSSYLIYYSNPIYNFFKPILGIFEINKQGKRGVYSKDINGHIILFGFHRLGEDLFSAILENKSEYLIIDHNPSTIERLAKDDINVVYGDMHDVDLYDKLAFEKARLVISTVPSKSATLTLLKNIENLEVKPHVIVTAQNDMEAGIFYQKGADFVIYPHLHSAQRLKSIIDNMDSLDDKLVNFSKKDIKLLEKRLLNLLD